jgi:hypothetical protein
VIEQAVEDMPKKEALKEKTLHIMNTCFGPELAKKVRKQHSGTGTSRPKGDAKAKSEDMDDDDLEKDILANINGHPPP